MYRPHAFIDYFENVNLNIQKLVAYHIIGRCKESNDGVEKERTIKN
jgi:hypothetical protein